ncbi:MAG: AraC family transcriptional regulator [Fimbriimonadaceae bacterium]|nr:AraC family transcriptional regulator [Fimbriimonadaceae bacterium]QYK57848.1 MAG: AraC family transcriptional regulator [Fimbriimonadaceae bacterium]
MDVLSSFLFSVHLSSEIYLSVEMSAPWGVSFPDQPDCALFYAVSRGSCYIQVEGERHAVPLAGGDIVMLPCGSPHKMTDQPDRATTPVETVRASGTFDKSGVFHSGGGGPRTHMMVGRFRFVNHSAIPLLTSMPNLIRLRDGIDHKTTGLAATLQMLASETTSSLPGKEILMDRLADVLFVQILRANVKQEEEEGRDLGSRAGLMQALMDPELARALSLMHTKPEHPWSVAELAERVGMSRTAFALRFKSKAGVGPLEHLTQWRIQRACELLRESRKTLNEVAWRVGYESGAAFSRAFRREVGVSPGQFRRQAANSAAD